MPAASALNGAGSSTIDTAAQRLAQQEVYVDGRAEQKMGQAGVQRIEQRIAADRAGPMYIAILPASAAQAAGGDANSALAEIASELSRPGTYAAVIGKQFRARATSGILPKGEAGRLATQAFDAHRSEGVTAVLLDFVDRVGKERHGGGGSGSSSSNGWIWAVLAALGLGWFAVSRSRRRRREQAELEQVKHVARDDLIALGDDIRALDLDTQSVVRRSPPPDRWD